MPGIFMPARARKILHMTIDLEMGDAKTFFIKSI